MKGEGIITHTFRISRPGQIVLFQVKIPREVDHIIGVGFDFRWMSGTLPATTAPVNNFLPMDIKRQLYLGTIKLRSYEMANIFYAGHVMLPNPVNFGDYTNPGFAPTLHSHQSRLQREEVKVSGRTTLIQGVFKDKMNENISGEYVYQMNVFITTSFK